MSKTLDHRIIVDVVLSPSKIPTTILKPLLRSPLYTAEVEVEYIKTGGNNPLPDVPIDFANKLKDYISECKRLNISKAEVIARFEASLKEHKINLPGLPKLVNRFWELY